MLEVAAVPETMSSESALFVLETPLHLLLALPDTLLIRDMPQMKARRHGIFEESDDQCSRHNQPTQSATS